VAVAAAHTMEPKVISKAAAASPAYAHRGGPSRGAQGWGRLGFGSAPATKAVVLRMCADNNSATPVTKYVRNGFGPVAF
jgi:chorismate mutase